MRKVCLGGLAYKEEIVSLPDEFDAIYDRYVALDNKDFDKLSCEEEEELDNLASRLWDEVCSNHSSEFDTPLSLESEDGEYLIWED